MTLAALGQGELDHGPAPAEAEDLLRDPEARDTRLRCVGRRRRRIHHGRLREVDDRGHQPARVRVNVDLLYEGRGRVGARPGGGIERGQHGPESGVGQRGFGAEPAEGRPRPRRVDARPRLERVGDQSGAVLPQCRNAAGNAAVVAQIHQATRGPGPSSEGCPLQATRQVAVMAEQTLARAVHVDLLEVAALRRGVAHVVDELPRADRPAGDRTSDRAVANGHAVLEVLPVDDPDRPGAVHVHRRLVRHLARDGNGVRQRARWEASAESVRRQWRPSRRRTNTSSSPTASSSPQAIAPPAPSAEAAIRTWRLPGPHRSPGRSRGRRRRHRSRCRLRAARRGRRSRPRRPRTRCRPATGRRRRSWRPLGRCAPHRRPLQDAELIRATASPPRMYVTTTLPPLATAICAPEADDAGTRVHALRCAPRAVHEPRDERVVLSAVVLQVHERSRVVWRDVNVRPRRVDRVRWPVDGHPGQDRGAGGCRQREPQERCCLKPVPRRGLRSPVHRRECSDRGGPGGPPTCGSLSALPWPAQTAASGRRA